MDRWLALGDAAFDRGDYTEAVADYRECLTRAPDHAQARYNLAIALLRTGQKAEAKNLLRSLPTIAEASYNLGRIVQEEGRLELAIDCYRKALALRPDHQACRTYLADCNLMLGRFEAAEREYRIVLASDPHHFATTKNLGVTLTALGRPEEAIVILRQAVLLRPEDSASLGDLGTALAHAGRSVEALQHYRKAVELNPRSPAAWANLGTALHDLGSYDDAAGCAEQALALDPDLAAAHVNLAMIFLLRGDYAAGWRQYEWRAGGDRGGLQDGTDVAGKTILLTTEQGLGDTIQFVRFLPILLARGATPLVQAPAPLAALMAHSFPDVRLVSEGEAHPPHDLKLPLLSLPRLLGLTLAGIPAAVPYLRPDPPKTEFWRSHVPDAQRPRVGIAWTGGARFSNDRKRSLALSLLGPLLDDARVVYVSLQREIPDRDRDELGRRSGILRLGEQVGDFNDTAAIVASLDLIITVDTAVAHLAGALARPVWILLPVVPDWRWLLDRSDSPWYPTAALFRQESGERWEPLIDRVRVALRQWVDEWQPPTTSPGDRGPRSVPEK